MNHASNMTNVDSAGSETPAELRTLYLAGGCFWGLEAYLKRLPGVRGTVVGYANGSAITTYVAGTRATPKPWP